MRKRRPRKQAEQLVAEHTLSEHEMQMLFDHIREDNEQGRRCFGYVTVDRDGDVRVNWANVELAEAFAQSGAVEGEVLTHTSKLRTIQ